jgi:hypothetical protein
MVSEQRVFLVSNLNGGSTVLKMISSAVNSQNLRPDWVRISPGAMPDLSTRSHPAPSTASPSPGKVRTYLWNQNLVADGHAAADPLPVLIQATGTDGQDLGLVQLLDARLRQEDAGRGAGLGLDALDQHAVEEGREGLDGLECGGLLLVSNVCLELC